MFRMEGVPGWAGLSPAYNSLDIDGRSLKDGEQGTTGGFPKLGVPFCHQ